MNRETIGVRFGDTKAGMFLEKELSCCDKDISRKCARLYNGMKRDLFLIQTVENRNKIAILIEKDCLERIDSMFAPFKIKSLLKNVVHAAGRIFRKKDIHHWSHKLKKADNHDARRKKRLQDQGRL